MAARAAVVHPSITQLAHKRLTIRLCAGFTEVRKELAIGANTDKCLAVGTALPTNYPGSSRPAGLCTSEYTLRPMTTVHFCRAAAETLSQGRQATTASR